MITDGYILTGGGSSRMGRDKASLELNGHALASIAAEAVIAICRKVYAVGNPIDGLEFVDDLPHPEKASIYGLESALHHASAEWIAVAACDLPFITKHLFQFLMSEVLDTADTLDAVVPVQPDGRLQPLCALYRVDPVRKAVREMIAIGEFRLQALADQVRVKLVDNSELVAAGASANWWFNVNTAHDLEIAMRSAKTKRDR